MHCPDCHMTPQEFDAAEFSITGKHLKEIIAATAQHVKEAAEAKPTDLDSVAERILGAFKGEDDTRTDADLLAASGLDREAYLDARDFLLTETEEISELADGVPTEYVRNWARKVEAAA